MARQKARSRAETYKHEEEALLRPDVGTQAQFRKKRAPKTYRYDSSLSPALDWDDQGVRALGEWLLAQIEEAARLEPPHRFPEPRTESGITIEGLEDAVAELKKISRPFLDWAGKAERLSFDVPTLPLFVHERLSTKAILETLKGHERDRQMEMQLFADPQLPLHQQLEAYEHKGDWVNRLILGDSLAVMNSLLEYEGLGGQVQMNGSSTASCSFRKSRRPLGAGVSIMSRSLMERGVRLHEKKEPAKLPFQKDGFIDWTTSLRKEPRSMEPFSLSSAVGRTTQGHAVTGRPRTRA